MSTQPLIALTTDFGAASPYVAVMKGVILTINPAARIHDLTHSIRPQDIRHASYFLATAAPYFPAGTIHVCVVDPGVGSERAPICVEAFEQRFVGPDNGVFSGVYCRSGAAAPVHRLADRKYWRPILSDTFHGRDVFAPVAAHLSLGINPASLGPPHPHPVRLSKCSAVTFGRKWRGEVQFVDDFGNLITNISSCKLKSVPVKVSIGDAAVTVKSVRTYADAVPGELICLSSSDGFIEIAEAMGSASRRLGVVAGTEVEVECE